MFVLFGVHKFVVKPYDVSSNLLDTTRQCTSLNISESASSTTKTGEIDIHADLNFNFDRIGVGACELHL
jgi:hypothetical protein